MDLPAPTRTLRRLARLTAVLGVATALAGCAGSDADQPSAAEVRGGDPIDLSAVPWADPDGPHRIQDLVPLPSLRFPAGVDYQEALRRVFVAQVERQPSVSEASVEPPLPPEVVYVAPAAPDQGLRLSLTAPWGWDETGAIRLPSIALPGTLEPEVVSERIAAARQSGAALPEGAQMDVPPLEECQIGHGEPEARPPC